MFLLKIIRYILGYVRFSADGGNIEKFLNGAAQCGVMLWNIKLRDGVLQACALAKNYKKLQPAAAGAGVKLIVIRCVGLPFMAKKYGRRKGLVTGILLLIATLWFFSSFIWTVNISGNSATPSDEISDVLSDLGLRPGAFPLMLNEKSIEQEALLRLPDLSWITINIDGSAANVAVRERKYPPDVVPAGMPCNVKAAQTGQVIKLEIYKGKAMVKVGDTIPKDGLIISGVITDKNGAVMLMHADGKVIAHTQRELVVTVPYKQHTKIDTGKVIKKDTLGVFNFNVPLYFSKPDGDFRIAIDRQQMNILGLKLPFSLTKRSYIGMKEADVVYTKTQAAAIAAAQLKDEERTELAGIKILSKVTSSKEDNNGYNLIRNYYCEEDIAYQEAIAIS